jgi:translocation and assembly module TamB
LVSALVPSLEPIEARVDADFAVGGSVEQPEITGGMEMATGELHVVPLGLRLQGIEARVSSVADGVDVRLRVSSGGGRGELSARARRDPAGAWRASGRLIGTELLVADRPDLALTATPQLDWTMGQREVSVTGSVQVPMARITPRDLSRAVRPSPDAVVVRPDRGTPDAAATPPGWTVRADVAVVPGDDVRIDAFGLRGRVAGSLRLIEEPGQPTAALGELKIEEGTYSIYRQTLAIERGRVIYSGGPVTNPGLDVRAVRRPRNLVVGVNVRGTLQNPRAELFSEPPMPESQQLSYLVVGVPLGETSSAEGETLAAATSLLAGSKQPSQLAGRVGIDEIEVESGGPGEGTSVVLGRYLSPRLYIGYGIGLLQEANSVRLRYELTDLWSLEGQSGTHSSADLLYTIEVDSSADAVPPQLRRPASDGAGESSE